MQMADRGHLDQFPLSVPCFFDSMLVLRFMVVNGVRGVLLYRDTIDCIYKKSSIRIQICADMTKWWRVGSESDLRSGGGRLHCCVEGRYVTVFSHRGVLSVIDASTSLRCNYSYFGSRN